MNMLDTQQGNVNPIVSASEDTVAGHEKRFATQGNTFSRSRLFVDAAVRSFRKHHRRTTETVQTPSDEARDYSIRRHLTYDRLRNGHRNKSR